MKIVNFVLRNDKLVNNLTGHYKDPVEIPGLAHLCEHMLFMGTEKYPEEDIYDKVVWFDILI